VLLQKLGQIDPTRIDSVFSKEWRWVAVAVAVAKHREGDCGMVKMNFHEGMNKVE
jgi:replicative DNA helicase